MTTRTTREALLIAGVELFLEGGYDFVGTNAILARAKVPRGSFYHHFVDKEAFALAVAEYYYEAHLPALDRALGDDERPPVERLRRYFEALARDFARHGHTGGCLLGMFGQELADRSPAAREALARLFGRWRHRIADCLREARERGLAGRVYSDAEIPPAVAAAMWEPKYLQLAPAPAAEPAR